MRRFAPGWAHVIAMPLFEGEGGGAGTGDGGAGSGGGQKDAAYWEAEAKKAFAARDAAKGELKKLQEDGRVLTPEQKQRLAELEDAATKAEEERAKKAGEFETLKKNMLDKHQKELGDRDTQISTLSKRFQDTVVRAEFGTATDLFGGHDASKTVLDVDMAIAVLGRYVSVVDDDKSPTGYRIVVKDVNGNEIEDAKGNPLPFAQALAELIGGLPNKDRILRGSGKAGSGSSGGGQPHGQEADLETLTKRAAAGDLKAVKALKERRSGSGIVQGRAWENASASS